METVKITTISRFTTDKQGNPLTTKDGKPYTRVNIKTDKYGDKWISGFGNQTNAEWKEGDEVEIQVKQNGQYLNFTTPKKDDKLLAMHNEVMIKLGVITAKLDKLVNKLSLDEPPMPEPEEEPNPDGIPF